MVLAPKVAIQLAAADRFGAAIDIALTGGVAAVEVMRTTPDSASAPPRVATVKGEDAVARQRRAEHIAANMALVPVVLRLARMWLDRPADAVQGADDVIIACRLIGGSAVDPALWNTVSQLFEDVFRHRTPARELHSRSAELSRAHGTFLQTVAYVGASIQDDLRLEAVVRVHWEILLFLRAEVRVARVDRVLFLPLVEAFWRQAIVEQSYRFITPKLAAERFGQAVAAPPDARSEEILCAIAAGLGITLRKP